MFNVTLQLHGNTIVYLSVLLGILSTYLSHFLYLCLQVFLYWITFSAVITFPSKSPIINYSAVTLLIKLFIFKLENVMLRGISKDECDDVCTHPGGSLLMAFLLIHCHLLLSSTFVLRPVLGLRFVVSG